MAFRVPQFNLLCNIWTATAFGWPLPVSLFSGAPRLTNVACALTFPPVPSETFLSFGTGFDQVPIQLSILLLPVHTDIRGWQSPGSLVDGVECPAGSGRYYCVAGFEDRGKGHANEHRVAVMMPIPGGWPYGAP